MTLSDPNLLDASIILANYDFLVDYNFKCRFTAFVEELAEFAFPK
jgi:hypothetical protein